MVRYLPIESLIYIAKSAVGPGVVVRDIGLLESAAARPRTNMFGEDAYVTTPEKAAALLHSIVSNHPLLDGNKRLGFTATAVFLSINGCPLKQPEDIEEAAYRIVIDVASGEVSAVDEIAKRLTELLATSLTERSSKED